MPERDLEDLLRAVDAQEIDWTAPPVTTTPRSIRDRAHHAPLTTTLCACHRGWRLREGETRCWECQCHADEERTFLANANTPLSRDDALAELATLATAPCSDSGHEVADLILLRLLGDPAITAAFHAVPKWYA